MINEVYIFWRNVCRKVLVLNHVEFICSSKHVAIFHFGLPSHDFIVMLSSWTLLMDILPRYWCMLSEHSNNLMNYELWCVIRTALEIGACQLKVKK